MNYEPLQTAWTESIKLGVEPTDQALRQHLLAVHSRYAGFTESCAAQSTDSHGRNSYQWLAELVDPGMDVLDLACGSGVLLELCREKIGDQGTLVGVDMSDDELGLARERMGERVRLERGLAQDLSFLEDDSFDSVLCHWAMTLMDPIEPVLREIRRVLRPGGVFGAIVDGDHSRSQVYQRVNALIFESVAAEYPAYARYEMGDMRVRRRDELVKLIRGMFPGARIDVEPSVVRLTGTSAKIAREAVGFYYAAFVLSRSGHSRLLTKVRNYLNETAGFEMPIHRLVIRLDSPDRP